MSKKILYIANVDWFFISHRLNLAEEATSRGYEVHIATQITSHYESLLKRGFHIHRLSYKRSKSLLSITKEIYSFFQMIKLFITIKPDIVHLISLKPALYGGLLSILFKKPKIILSVTGTGFLFNSSGFFGKVFEKLVVYLFSIILKQKQVEAIFQNKENITYFKQRGVKFFKSPNLIKGSGVDIKKFTYSTEPSGQFTVMMISRLLKDKGVYEFVEASKILSANRINVRMILVGEIDENPMSITRKEVEKWVEDEILEWWGHRKDIYEVMKKSNVICLPSYHEGFPKVLMEAAASARAVITTDVAGCRDAIIQNVTGILVKKYSSNEIVDAICFLKENEKIRKKMGEEGRKLAVKKFNINLVTKKHFEIYQK